MGDHRAYIKIEMEFHGIKDQTDMDINYINSDGNGMDSRVADWFESVYERGMSKYREQVEEYFAKEHQKEIEDGERHELERLKAKYEP